MKQRLSRECWPVWSHYDQFESCDSLPLSPPSLSLSLVPAVSCVAQAEAESAKLRKENEKLILQLQQSRLGNSKFVCTVEPLENQHIGTEEFVIFWRRKCIHAQCRHVSWCIGVSLYQRLHCIASCMITVGSRSDSSSHFFQSGVYSGMEQKEQQPPPPTKSTKAPVKKV